MFYRHTISTIHKMYKFVVNYKKKNPMALNIFMFKCVKEGCFVVNLMSIFCCYYYAVAGCSGCCCTTCADVPTTPVLQSPLDDSIFPFAETTTLLLSFNPMTSVSVSLTVVVKCETPLFHHPRNVAPHYICKCF